MILKKNYNMILEKYTLDKIKKVTSDDPGGCESQIQKYV